MAQDKIILGIDEVGRGPWAGPLVVGAVILGTSFHNLDKEGSDSTDEKLSLYQNLADSKQLSAKKRTIIAPLIARYATASATGWVSSIELDQYGLSASLKLATRRAVKQILATKATFTEIIIDGTINFLDNTPLSDRVTLLKKADSLVKEVSAASIIAKVARDQYMVELAKKYPEYGFENHVGYGTTKHKSALYEYGICPEHRTSFRPIRTLIDQSRQEGNKNQSYRCRKNNITSNSLGTTAKGQLAENLVANYLHSVGHTIIAHNFKTKSYEIDLISTKNKEIFFTEVKYRQNTKHGSALAQITPSKQQQMHYAAKKFLSTRPDLSQFQPFLAVAAIEGEPPAFKTWFPLKS